MGANSVSIVLEVIINKLDKYGKVSASTLIWQSSCSRVSSFYSHVVQLTIDLWYTCTCTDIRPGTY